MGLQLPNDPERGMAAKSPLVWLVAVVLPCMITSYGSYRSARAEADAKAAAGYETLAASQKELQQSLADHIHADEKATAEITAELSILRQLVTRMYTADRETASGRARLPVQQPVAAAPVRHFDPPKALDLPPTLDAAQQVVNSKK